LAAVVIAKSDGRRKKKAKDKVVVQDVLIKSAGHSFQISAVPNTHVLVRKNRLAKLENSNERVKAMLGSLSGDRYHRLGFGQVASA
jgi:hypothetical protein